jgi:Reverse transcriptase (RNA-dependent DNA polymerase)
VNDVDFYCTGHICQSPDMAQEVMEKVLRDISDDIDVYIDDIGIFSSDWRDHMCMLDLVCKRLKSKGFSVNPLKCELNSHFTAHRLHRKVVFRRTSLKTDRNSEFGGSGDSRKQKRSMFQ